MSDYTTIGDLFDLAIAAEKFGEKFYRGLAAKFASYPEVADFWQMYAEEEVQHAQWLEQIRAATTAERLSTPADPQMLERAKGVLQYSLESALANIHDLEEAYQLVVGAETAEGDAIFGFLIEHFSSDERAGAFIRAQIGDHYNVARRFPVKYKSRIARQATKALDEPK